MHELCGRPVGFESKILKQIVHKVKKDDILIHLGDICWYKHDYWNEQLREACAGKLWLIRGNHDKKSITWYMGKGYDCVTDRLMLKVFGHRIIFSHKPLNNLEQGYINIHGHLHNSDHHPECSRNHLLFIEHHYTPKSIMEIINETSICKS
jgi:calcineurin-like phosphoesterase family protein